MAQQCSLMTQIRKVEESITTGYDRIYALKAKLRSVKLKDKQKDDLQTELVELEKLLATNKKILKNLHKNNKNTFYLASALCLIIFIIWMLYELFAADIKAT